MNTQQKTAMGGEGLAAELPRSGIATRFIAANFGALLFAGAASLLASRWIGDLDDLLTLPGAIILVA
ncbi:MAG: hypothetical protein AABZ63_01215, partial [Actinomycetota bacterium]